MYSNEKNPGLNWKDLLIKLIFVVVFILLLIWLFKINTPNMKPFYSNQFRENIKYMQDAAESYYTNERLPKNLGDSAEISLRDMINKNLILPFVDEDGNSCDLDASYVEVTKNQNDYTLKTTLVCPKEKNTVVKTLGCYNYCEDCNKDEVKKVTEYQFKKEASKTTYSLTCPNGGNLKDGTCSLYEKTSYKAAEKTTTGEYYCPNGGTLNGKICVISKETSYKPYTSTTNGYYTCPAGYTLNGSKCYKTSSSTDTVNATAISTCPSGYTLSGSKCTKTIAYTDRADFVTSYTCPSGYTLSGSKCTKTTTSGGYTYTASESFSYKYGQFRSKPSGYTCSYVKVDDCSSGVCLGKKYVYTGCYKSNGYYCPDGGTLSGTTCTVRGTSSTSTKDATASKTCPSGYTSNGSYCTRTSSYIDTKNADVTYSCPNGYVSNGNGTCSKVINNTETRNATYVNGTTKTYCDNGDTLKNGMCYVSETTKYNASKTEGKTSYLCNNGGTLNNATKLCEKTVLVNNYAATKVSKVSKGYTYKWSTSETLAGWTRTGATRTSTVKVSK